MTKITQEDLLQRLKKEFQTPGCEVINDDIANDDAYIKHIKDRLNSVGNHPFGSIPAGLKAKPKLSSEERTFIQNAANSIFDPTPLV